MSDTPYEQLLIDKRGQVFQNKKKIIRALEELKKPASSYGFKDFLDTLISEENKTIRREARSKYENGQLSASERNEYIKKKTKKPSSLRTIQRYLPKLEKEGVLGHQSNEYFIQYRDVARIRYFAEDFGGFILDKMMKNHFPTLFPIGENLKKLIEIFGVYVIYCLSEAAKPLEGKVIDSIDNDQLSTFWAKNVFDGDMMYRYFLGALQNQPEDKDVKRYVNNLKVDENGEGWVDYEGNKISFAPTTADFSHELFNKIPYTLENWPKQPLYALDHNKINKITAILQECYPLLYDESVDLRKIYGKESLFKK